MSKIIAYASSTRPNHLWSAAQYNSALPKNRIDADIPLVSAAALATKDATIAGLRTKLGRILREYDHGRADPPVNRLARIAMAIEDARADLAPKP